MLTITFTLYDIPIVIASFFGMEAVARLMHKYLMHGILWPIHKDHHIDMGHKFQRNNLFGLIFSAISIFLFIETFLTGSSVYASIGFGLLFYGIAYLIIHDMIIHNKYIHLRYRHHSKYMDNIIAVHEYHHTYRGDKKGVNWGFLLYVPGIDKKPPNKVNRQ